MAKRGRHLAPRIRRISRTWVIPMTLVMSLVLGGVAWADDISNNLDATVDSTAEVMNLTQGGANGSAQLYVVPQNDDGKNGCNLTGSTTLVVSINTSNGAVATVTPNSVTFDSCGATPTITVVPVAPGSATISLSETSNTTSGSFNLLPATFTVNVVAPAPADTTPPAISYVLNPAAPDGDNGWYTSNVTLTWTVTESEFPSSLIKVGCVDQNITADQGEETYSCSATSDGGSAGPVSVTIKRDATAPTITGWSNGPQDGQSYYFGSVPAEPTCTASDSGSGLTAAECMVSGYGTKVGNHKLVASATDNAGNTGSEDRDYTVLAWTLNGFYQPVDMDKVNTVKAGSTVPLKFEAFAGSTELTDVSVVDAFTVKKVSCTSFNGEPIDDVEFTTTGGTILRYDWTAGQFIQNWQTPKGAGLCYTVMMTTDDGSNIGPTYFKTK